MRKGVSPRASSCHFRICLLIWTRIVTLRPITVPHARTSLRIRSDGVLNQSSDVVSPIICQLSLRAFSFAGADQDTVKQGESRPSVRTQTLQTYRDALKVQFAQTTVLTGLLHFASPRRKRTLIPHC